MKQSVTKQYKNEGEYRRGVASFEGMGWHVVETTAMNKGLSTSTVLLFPATLFMARGSVLLVRFERESEGASHLQEDGLQRLRELEKIKAENEERKLQSVPIGPKWLGIRKRVK